MENFKSIKQRTEAILPRVEKPSRYTGGEFNSIVKQNAQLYFALCFPDVYEIGMSHLGSHILYSVLNNDPDVACERAYAPWVDMESQMRAHNIPMHSLETSRPLRQFDIIGFSLLYEMCYTNILTMLELSDIPFFSRERNEDCPLIIAGGPCVCNCEPVADFFDAILFGDGEEVVLEVATIVKNAKRTKLSRHETLLRLSHVEGVYIPSFYTPRYNENGMFEELEKTEATAPDSILRRIVSDLNKARYVTAPVVPFTSVVHDRVSLELFRGCTRGCRFCQAGYIYRPIRERTCQTILDQAESLISCTGHDEISLMSLSSGDYSEINDVVAGITDNLYGKRISLSLPSLRIDSIMKENLERIQTVRKTGLTFAPEAGTQRLRDVINKGVSEEDLLDSVRSAFESGWSSVKLYFMIGLPTETDEDILGIADLARKVVDTYYSLSKEQRQTPPRVSVSASSFVPKPHTPFQWVAQNTLDELKRKQRLLADALKPLKRVEFSYHDPYISGLEAVFARGDRRLAQAIVTAYKNGARFDSWDEHFKPAVWDEALSGENLTHAMYAHRERELCEPLPWSHMNTLVTLEYFKNEYIKALQGVATGDCRQGCNACFGKLCTKYCTMVSRQKNS